MAESCRTSKRIKARDDGQKTWSAGAKSVVDRLYKTRPQLSKNQDVIKSMMRLTKKKKEGKPS